MARMGFADVERVIGAPSVRKLVALYQRPLQTTVPSGVLPVVEANSGADFRQQVASSASRPDPGAQLVDRPRRNIGRAWVTLECGPPIAEDIAGVGKVGRVLRRTWPTIARRPEVGRPSSGRSARVDSQEHRSVCGGGQISPPRCSTPRRPRRHVGGRIDRGISCRGQRVCCLCVNALVLVFSRLAALPLLSACVLTCMRVIVHMCA